MNSAEQSIPFDQWMHHKLYHPTEGYYCSPIVKIGKQGDFLTTPTMSTLFAEILAEKIARVQKEDGLSPCIAEFGAGTLALYEGIAAYWAKKYPEQNLTYMAIDVSAYHRSSVVSSFENVNLITYESVEQWIASYMRTGWSGVWLSNEFWDALCTKRVRMEDTCWYEQYVFQSTGSSEWKRIHDEALLQLIQTTLPNVEHMIFEVSPALSETFQAISAVITKGRMLHFDYFLSNEFRAHPSRKNGTLRGYFKHSLIEDVLSFPDACDITYDVSCEHFEQTAEKCGWGNLQKTKQGTWLVENGLLQKLAETTDSNPFSETHRRNRQIQQWVFGEGMGNAFDVYEAVKK
ncbi:MAG: SAM-dependent methyltransferase [Bacilli bacterium]